MQKWQRFRYLPCIPLGPDGRKITGSKEHIALSRMAAAEGMVLLKNNYNLLPLKKGAKIALFGKASADYVKGGGGSGDVTVQYVLNLCDGMDIKQKEGKLFVFEPLNEFYRAYVKEKYDNSILPGKVAEPTLPEQLLESAVNYADIAIISICRYSNEGADRTEKDDFYLTEEEKHLVETVSSAFDKTILVLNVGGIVDSSYFVNNDKIPAVLLAWQGGMEGGLAQADILCGDVCPSGKLTDTFAKSFADYPSSDGFNKSEDFVEYTEDIFVGYRYFETIPNAQSKVNYPFGFGMSYTDFHIETISAKIENSKIIMQIKVTNIGNVSGKEVVQIYTSGIGGRLEKPMLELRAFSKTMQLSPGESCLLNIDFAVEELSVYDEANSSFILDKGVYRIYVGNSVRNISKAYELAVDEETVIKKVKNRCVPRKLSKRMKSDGEYELLETSQYDAVLDTSDWPEKPVWKFDHIQPDFRDTARPKDRILLNDVAENKSTIEELLSQMSDKDLVEFVGGRPNTGVANTWGIGDMQQFDIPSVMTADGPAGLRIKPEVGVCTTAWPCATLLACTWNTELVYEVGKAGALEVKENNLGMWLTPALNIHRSPLCGRNFEYYSEDPVVSGKMAAAMVRGIQSQNISSCVKHFACNNKETNRFASDSIVSERALREIYLKGFSIVVEETQPWAIMTSYNIINGRYSSENSDLIKGILREEWGFSGLVVSDWGNWAEHYREILAGNNLRMPSSSGKRLLKALEMGLIDRNELEYNAKYIIEFLLKLD